MPTVFLSYAREDLEQATRIEQQLTTVGVAVWRDQQKLRAGLNWPKALGEAIAASDALVMLWSRRAAESSFVELEWSVALALKKRVIPCRLDRSPLPASLAATQAIQPDGIAEAASAISLAMAQETQSADQSQIKKVVCQLAEIGGGDPSEVLLKAKAVFALGDLTIRGSVYQATGDIHIGTSSPSRTLLEKWQAWVAIAVGVVTVITLATQMVRTTATTSKGPPAPAKENVLVQEQLMTGSIWDEAGEPLANVRVSVLLGNRLLATDQTDSLGRFTFQATAPADADVMVIAQKDHYQTEKRYTHLGNQGFNFMMRRKQN
jgi:hypothetical protein